MVHCVLSIVLLIKQRSIKIKREIIIRARRRHSTNGLLVQVDFRVHSVCLSIRPLHWSQPCILEKQWTA